MYDVWKRAVVHLECATDSISLSERLATYRQALADAGGGLPSDREVEDFSTGSRDGRYHGTALFLRDDATGRRFLATARHVLFDDVEANRRLEEVAQRYVGIAPEALEHVLAFEAERAKDQIFRIIFRVPSLAETAVSDVGIPPASLLMNLGAGGCGPYSFSDPELDLAVVSLDGRGRGMESSFADRLESLGHLAMPLSRLGDAPSGEGAELFTVGYPITTSPVASFDLPADLLLWRSPLVSLPTFSFGRVAMLHPLLPYFWADMTIYPGNSGGPVVEGDSLVGLVVEQASLADNPIGAQRVPFCKAIRGRHLKDLLMHQMRRDAEG